MLIEHLLLMGYFVRFWEQNYKLDDTRISRNLWSRTERRISIKTMSIKIHYVNLYVAIIKMIINYLLITSIMLSARC